MFSDPEEAQASAFPPPRPFQETAHHALREGFKNGHKNQLIMSPTGSGKTYLGHRIAHEALAKGKTVVFLCDRTTLINQTSETADQYGLSQHGIVQANHWRRNTQLPYQIASAQTLAKRGYWPQADVIIIDEAHTQLKVWTDFIQTTKAACIGLSATPFSPGLGKLFTNLINATTMNDLTKSGVLVPMRMFSCKKIDMRGAHIAGGEWTDKAAEERGMDIIGDVVSEWLKYGENRKTIVFGATINHCKELAQKFVDAGVHAAVFTSETTSKERDVLLKEYRQPNSLLKVLVSVEALAKGFDVPSVGCVVDSRPLRKSLSTAIQMWGRGLRSSPDTGKQDCILLDHSGNIQRFAEDYTDIYFNGLDKLDSGEKLDKKVREDEQDDYQPKPCPACGYTPFAKRCMACGHETQKLSLTEVVPGVMQEITIGKGKDKTKLANDHRHLWEQVATYARIHSAPEKQPYRAKHLFTKIAGFQPPSEWAFHTTPDVTVTDGVSRKIRQLNISYAKGIHK